MSSLFFICFFCSCFHLSFLFLVTLYIFNPLLLCMLYLTESLFSSLLSVRLSFLVAFFRSQRKLSLLSLSLSLFLFLSLCPSCEKEEVSLAPTKRNIPLPLPLLLQSKSPANFHFAQIMMTHESNVILSTVDRLTRRYSRCINYSTQ